MKIRAVVTMAILFGLTTANQALAGFFNFTPNPPPPSPPPPPPPAPPPVPEFDGPGAIAAIALLASIGVLLFHRLRPR